MTQTADKSHVFSESVGLCDADFIWSDQDGPSKSIWHGLNCHYSIMWCPKRICITLHCEAAGCRTVNTLFVHHSLSKWLLSLSEFHPFSQRLKSQADTSFFSLFILYSFNRGRKPQTSGSAGERLSRVCFLGRTVKKTCGRA